MTQTGKYAVIARQGTFRHSTPVIACFDDQARCKAFASVRRLLAIVHATRFTDDPTFRVDQEIFSDSLHREYFPL